MPANLLHVSNLSNEWLDDLSQLDPQRYEIDVDENEDHEIF